MNVLQSSAQHAGRLLYKALHTTLVPINDMEYRELLALYRADPGFADKVQQFATGMELAILDVSERGLVVVPASRDSKFAIKMTDIRAGLDAKQKAALLLAHVAIAATFFPMTDGLDDDNFVPPPSCVADFRGTLHALAKQLQACASPSPELPVELMPGWDYIASLAVVVPTAQRASLTSVVGFIRLALKHMREGGLVRLDRETDDEEAASYTPTQRLRVQLRELALRRLFDIAQAAARGEGA